MGIRTSIDLKLDPPAAFDALVGELSTALSDLGMQFEPGVHGRVMEGTTEVGPVIRWQPHEKITLEWHGADWQPGEATTVELRFEPIEGGTRVTLEQPTLSSVLGDQGDELAGWFASEVAGPLLHALAPRRLGDWITDRKARRPSGPQARAYYRDPLYHRPNFRAILNVLGLTQNDYLLEVGCGGGAFLEEALKSGCKAAAIDHSSEMVRLARQANHEAIARNRLEIREGNADSLPYRDGTFTCAVMTGVFGFLSDPLQALSEVRRVLAGGGRFVLFTGSKELRGTPAAPEPMASRLYFYEDQELEELARKAGFAEAVMERPDFEQFAREAGIPEEFLGLFKGTGGGQLLVAHKRK
ncbi:MAG TPA: methyltransferase domain-containing protein [Terriglobia bacterium]|nr:methyltransferase domain-containing protein [Terriglobia bacterium]